MLTLILAWQLDASYLISKLDCRKEIANGPKSSLENYINENNTHRSAQVISTTWPSGVGTAIVNMFMILRSDPPCAASRREPRRQAAQDRVLWNSLQKTYVQQWTSIGWHDDDDDDRTTIASALHYLYRICSHSVLHLERSY
ncbi:jg4454 [Pararge aegeria aegeria]|uniref:Jg4454 protein n=1 Tax=Pararge aegeria aegeria TaxID=348720 RepID=A0A8S4S1V2_9NEOP|nr:jg4454 [Pararge aegeria aegeria]